MLMYIQTTFPVLCNKYPQIEWLDSASQLGPHKAGKKTLAIYTAT